MTKSERALLLFLAAEKLDEIRKISALFSDVSPSVTNLESLISDVEAEVLAPAS